MKFSTLLVLALIYTASAAESSSFQANNAKEAKTLTAQFAKLTPNSPCNNGEQACVQKQFAQCVGGSFQMTKCSSGTECTVLPLVNKPGTSIACDTPADQQARLAAASGQNPPPTGDGSSLSSGSSTDPSGNSTDPAVGNNKKDKGKKNKTSKKNQKNKKEGKKDKNNENNNGQLNDNQGQNNGTSGQLNDNQGQNNGTSGQVNDNQGQNKKNKKEGKKGKKGKNNKNNNGQLNDNQGQNNGTSGQLDDNQGQNNGTSGQVNDNQGQNKKNKKEGKKGKKGKNNKNNNGQLNDNQGQNNGTSGQVNDNQGQNNGTPSTSLTTSAKNNKGNNGNNGGSIQQQNAAEAESLQGQFNKLTPDSSCNSGENACVDKKFAQCVNGKFALTDCGSGTECAALPLVLSKGTSVACTTEADRVARINAAKSAKN